jgi:hypothetical protein
MNREIFDKKRDAFRKNVTKSKEMANELAVAAGAHFAEHGDTSYIADFYSDLRGAGKNFVRSSAFLAWLVAHFPVKMEQNKFVKDQELATKMDWADDDKRNALVAKSQEKPFYDFAPEAVVEDYKADTIIVSLTKALAKFENSKHYRAENPEAVAMLARAKGVIATLKAPVAANTDAPEISSAAA